FAPRDESEEPAESLKKESKPAPVKVVVDFDGIEERILQLPVKPGTYDNVQSQGSTVYYNHIHTGNPKWALSMYDMATRKETALGPVLGYRFSGNGKKMIVVLENDKYGIIDLPKGPVTVDEPINLSGMEMKLDRRAEWRQIYHECWRHLRHFFWDP